MKRLIVLSVILLLLNKISAEIPRTIKFPLWKHGISLSLRGSADVFKEPNEDSPKLLVEGAGWGGEYPYGINFWSDEPEPTGGKNIYRHTVNSGQSNHPLVAYDGQQWYKVQVYDREGWLHIGGNVPTYEFEPLVLNSEGTVKADVFYSNDEPYIYVRQDGRYKGLCAMVFNCPNGVEGIAFGAMINGMAIMPLFLPMRIECSYADLPLQITFANSSERYGKMRFPCSKYSDGMGGLNLNKFSDEQIINLIQKTSSLNSYLIAFKLKNHQAKITEFNTLTASVPIVEVPFQPGNYELYPPHGGQNKIFEATEKIERIPERIKEELMAVEENTLGTPSDALISADLPPSFPGGPAAMMSWIGKNMKYPDNAQMRNVQGRVIVKFIVTADGGIANAQIVNGVDKDLDNEALRIIRSMPKWIPGESNGRKVNVWVTLPVTFKLSS